MTSKILRFGQHFIIKTQLYRVFIPFTSFLNKFYHLTKFAVWKSKFIIPLKGFKNRYELYKKVIETENLDLIYFLEFGVSKGESLKWWLKQIKNSHSLFWGFDTFNGIPEAWGTVKSGSYTNDGNIPYVEDDRCRFYVGLFQETIKKFLNENVLQQRLVVHLDADLYSSTLFCLFSLGPYFKKDDILIFDEFDVTTHEFKAFIDFQSCFSLPYTVIGESNNFNKIVIKIQ